MKYNRVDTMKPLRQYSARACFILILAISLILRWALVMQGGQFFNPDEYRYLTSRVIAREIQKGNYDRAVTEATRRAGHLGFKIIGILPALLEVKHDRDINSQTALIPALFFSLFSWVNLILVWLLARRLGADEREALWAVFLAGTSNALFYYSSHLFPYDLAMTFGLSALYAGVSAKGETIWVSLAVGFLGFLCFFTYNGYWTLTAFAFLVHIFSPGTLRYRWILKAGFTALGFFFPLIAILRLATMYGNDLLRDYVIFSQNVTNGLFSEGPWIPFKYFWASEQTILIIWLLLLSCSIFFFFRKPSRRILVWLAGVFFLYACLSISSALLLKFVVYARLARELVPFLALAGAYSLRVIEADKRIGKICLAFVLLVGLIQAQINFRKPLRLIYPTEFIQEVREQLPDFRPPKNITYFYSPNVTEAGAYRAYLVQFVYPLPKEEIPIEGEILMSAENPLSSFPPFWFDEGYSPQERSAFPTLMMRITRIE
jgi:hypothetical protein